MRDRRSFLFLGGAALALSLLPFHLQQTGDGVRLAGDQAHAGRGGNGGGGGSGGGGSGGGGSGGGGDGSGGGGNGGGNSGGSGGSNGSGNGGGQGRSGNQGNGRSRNASAAADDAADDDDAGKKGVGASIDLNVRHANGTTESIQGDRYVMRDARARTIVNRRATASDRDRLEVLSR